MPNRSLTFAGLIVVLVGCGAGEPPTKDLGGIIDHFKGSGFQVSGVIPGNEVAPEAKNGYSMLLNGAMITVFEYDNTTAAGVQAQQQAVKNGVRGKPVVANANLTLWMFAPQHEQAAAIQKSFKRY